MIYIFHSPFFVPLFKRLTFIVISSGAAWDMGTKASELYGDYGPGDLLPQWGLLTSE